MAKVELRPIDKADKTAVIEALMNYKKQNPVKFEQKKVALFAKYGLEDEAISESVKDETDEKLEKKLAESKKK